MTQQNPDAAPRQPSESIQITPEAQRLRDEVQANLAAIVESSDDAIVSKTLDGIIRTWNSGAERIFGYSAAEAVGMPVTMLIPPERRDEEPRIIERLLRGERVDHFETIRIAKDGRHIEVSVTISPIRDRAGNIVGASKVARDISRQKQFERELQEARDAAEAATLAKDQFLSVLSHELRTPLTPALGALSHLESRGDLSAALREDLGMIRRNVEAEARLVDDLLDLTRINRGKIQLHFEIVDAHSALRSALAMFQADIDNKSLEAAVALRAQEHYVWADPARLQQVFLNILSNAVKFTPAGGRISLRSHNAGGGMIVEFQDSGIGIEADVLPRLFTAFEQGEQSVSRLFGGLGLGLSIAHSLIEMHNSVIRAASEGKGRGTSIVIEMPTVAAEPASSPPPSSGERIALRVLLVEDHEDTRRVMEKLLASFGCTVRSAGTAAQALAIADDESFDLLVSDLGLPDGRGTDVMRELKTRQNLKGIAVSGFGQAEDIRRSREAGFETHLTKPVNFNTLQEVIKKVAG